MTEVDWDSVYTAEQAVEIIREKVPADAGRIGQVLISSLKGENRIRSNKQLTGREIEMVANELIDSVAFQDISQGYDKEYLVNSILSGDLGNYVFNLGRYRRIRKAYLEEFKKLFDHAYYGAIRAIQLNEKSSAHLKTAEEAYRTLKQKARSASPEEREKILEALSKGLEQVFKDLGIPDDYPLNIKYGKSTK